MSKKLWFGLLFFFIVNRLQAEPSITLRWVFQPDRSSDFTVGARDGLVTLGDGQGINFQKRLVDSARPDFILKLIHDSSGNHFYLIAPTNSLAAFIDMGQIELHTLPIAPDTGYGNQPAPLGTGNSYSLKTADGSRYAKIFVVEQTLENPRSGNIRTGNDWIPVELTYQIPVELAVLEKYELPYLDQEKTLQTEINLQSMELIEQITGRRHTLTPAQIKEIVHHPQIIRDTLLWWNRGKVLKYYKMQRRYNSVDTREGFMDIYLRDGQLLTVYPPDTTSFLFRQSSAAGLTDTVATVGAAGTIDTVCFSGFFWLEELGKSTYNPTIWDRTWQNRKGKKFVVRIRF